MCDVLVGSDGCAAHSGLLAYSLVVVSIRVKRCLLCASEEALLLCFLEKLRESTNKLGPTALVF